MRTVLAACLAMLAMGCGSEPAVVPANTEPAARAELAAEARVEASAAAGHEPGAERDEPPAGGQAGSASTESPPPEVERPYDEDADAQAQIDAAVTAAAGDEKRVLLVFGANWCSWCRRLDWVLRNEPRVAAALERDYHLVHVDVGERGSDTNRQVAARYGDPLSNGLPCLVVLDEAGGVEHVQETGLLEDGDRHDPGRILAFLERWRRAGAAEGG